jgi:glycosyltransferase involved in cell wall biosynthesis
MTGQGRKLRVVMLDLPATVPYYSAYLTKFLKQAEVDVDLQAITYYLDRECFRRCGVENRTYFADWVSGSEFSPGVRRLLKLAEYVANLTALAMHMMDRRPDVLHVQFLPGLKWKFPFELWFLRFVRKLGVPVVYTVHDLLPHDTGERLEAVFAKAYALADRLICHSEDVKKQLQERFGVASQKIAVVPHGPLFYDFAPSKKGAGDLPLVLWQGIIFPYKGLDFLLEAWKRLMDEGVRAQLSISGTGSEEMTRAIEEKTKALGVTESVQLDFRYVPVEEMLSMYASADVVVYPYKAVTTSGALLTGLAQGKAIVATDLPYFRHALEEGKLGRLVEYGDVAGLAGRMRELLTDASRRLELERAVRSRNLGKQMWVDIAQVTAACYQQLQGTSL